MKAIAVDGERLAWCLAADPIAGAGEVCIRVRAAGVNRADLVQRAGLYPPPPGASEILGLEVAGRVEAVGAGVDPSWVGRDVAALLDGGGYAERVVCPVGQVLPVPRGLSWVEAASLPEVYATVWCNLVFPGRELAGVRVLLHAGASGVGTAAIQVCRWLGARTFVTAGSAEKVARCVALGADGGAVRGEGSWADAVLTWAPEGVDVVLDPVGAAYLADNQRCLATDGRIVLIGLLGGRTAPLDLGRLLVKRQHLEGSTLRSRSAQFKARLVADLGNRLWPQFDSGELRPIVHSTVPMPDADAAHRLLASNETFGKVVLTLPGAP